MAEKPRVVVVRGGARSHAVVAPRAAVQVDQHRGGAVEKPVLGHELQHVLGNRLVVALRPRHGCLLAPNERRESVRPQLRQDDRLHDRGRNDEDVHVAHGAQRVSEGDLLLGPPVVGDLVEPVHLPFPQVAHGPASVLVALQDPREAGADEDEPVRVVPLLGDDGLARQALLGAPVGDRPVRGVPVEVPERLERRLLRDTVDVFRGKPPEEGRLLQVDPQAARAVELVDVPLDLRRAASQLPETLPADLEELGRPV